MILIIFVSQSCMYVHMHAYTPHGYWNPFQLFSSVSVFMETKHYCKLLDVLA